MNSSPSRKNERESMWRRPSPRSGIVIGSGTAAAAFFEPDPDALAGGLAVGLPTGFAGGLGAGLAAGLEGRFFAPDFEDDGREGFAFDDNEGASIGAPPTSPIYGLS